MTDRLAFHTLDVFTDRRYGGNPLAVVLAADGLNTRQMQTVAREFNLSETVFVQAATDAPAQFKVRIFTPDVELPFAGHPTVGTACLLAELGLAPQGDDVRFVLEENVGLVPVRVVREAGRPLFGALTTAVLPAWSPNGAADVPSNAVLAEMLGLAADDIGANGPGYDEAPRACSCAHRNCWPASRSASNAGAARWQRPGRTTCMSTPAAMTASCAHACSRRAPAWSRTRPPARPPWRWPGGSGWNRR